MADLIETVFWIVLLLLGWAGPALKRLFERSALEELEDDDDVAWQSAPPAQPQSSVPMQQRLQPRPPPLPSAEQLNPEQFSYDDQPAPWLAEQRALAAETVRRATEIAQRKSRRQPPVRRGRAVRLDRDALLGALVLESSLTSRRSLRIRPR